MKGGKIRKIVACASAIIALGSLVFSYWSFANGFRRDDPVKVAQAIILAGWIVLPPVWFWLEFYLLYLPDSSSYEAWDQYKYGQDLASKIWLALVTTLLGLYFGNDLMRGGGG